MDQHYDSIWEKTHTALKALLFSYLELLPIIFAVAVGPSILIIVYSYYLRFKGRDANLADDAVVGMYASAFLAMFAAYLHQLGSDRIIGQLVPSVSLMLLVLFHLLQKAKIINVAPMDPGETVLSILSGTLSFLVSARYFEKLLS